MDANQPDGGILIIQNRKYPDVQQIEETGSPLDNVSLKNPGNTDDTCIRSRHAYGGVTFACSSYRSVRQLEDPCRE